MLHICFLTGSTKCKTADEFHYKHDGVNLGDGIENAMYVCMCSSLFCCKGVQDVTLYCVVWMYEDAIQAKEVLLGAPGRASAMSPQ